MASVGYVICVVIAPIGIRVLYKAIAAVDANANAIADVDANAIADANADAIAIAVEM